MLRKLTLAFAIAGVASLFARTASAEELLIKHPGDHPEYRFDAEPHGLIGWGPLFGRDVAFGAGFRGTFIIVDNGFVKTINNNVGIGVGGDFVFNGGKRRGEFAFIVPVVMQWNFFLSTHWSVFGEPGFAIAFNANHPAYPVFAAGGRYHFSEKIALTMRLGYPAASVGVSFLF